MIHMAKDVERSKPSCTIGKNLNWCGLYEKQPGVSQKIKNRTTVRSRNSTPGYLSEENKNTDSKIYTYAMHTTEMFTKAKTWTQPKCLSTK